MVAALGLVAAAAPARALIQVSDGVWAIDPKHIDDVLNIRDRGDVGVLIVADKEPQNFSAPHLKAVRDWVDAGGVLWIQGRGLESTIARDLAQPKVASFDYTKPTTGKKGGELITRDDSTVATFADHPFLEGVQKLYLFPAERFNDTPNATPLVQMKDSKGNNNVVLAAVPVGVGWVVLDGTLREDGVLPFSRVPGFNPRYPNATKQGGDWVSYDWDKIRDNARRVAVASLSNDRGDVEKNNTTTPH
jgi:hypothetical protein